MDASCLQKALVDLLEEIDRLSKGSLRELQELVDGSSMRCATNLETLDIGFPEIRELLDEHQKGSIEFYFLASGKTRMN